MANWASVSYRIEGNKNDLQKVFGVIDDFMTGRKKPDKERTLKEWEGNVIKELGATEEQMANNYLRGFIQTYEKDGDIISIEAEEAWGANDFRHILVKLIPELTIYYVVEEPDCEVYATNDSEGKYFTDRFYVNACINGNFESDYFTTKESAMNYAASLLGKEKVSEADIKGWNEGHKADSDFIYIHAFEYVP